MAETAGVSRSSISRQAIEGSAEQLRQLRERRWDKTDLLVIYIDGQRFGDHHVISGVGIDRGGFKTHPGHRAGRHGKRGRGEESADRIARPAVCAPTSSIFS